MKSALLVINTTTYFTGLIEIGRLFKKRSQYKPVFYFTQPYSGLEEHIKICKREGIKAICGFGRVNIVNSAYDRLNTRQKTIRKFYIWLYGIFFIGFCYEIQWYLKEYIKIHRLIALIKPSILVLGGDNLGYNTEILIKICHKLNIPSVIISLWMAHANEAAEAYFGNPAYDGKKFFNRLLGYIDPKWIYIHRGKKLIRWPAFKILAIRIFGLEPVLPWILNSSHADKILAAHQEMYDFMSEQGISSKQLVLTGAIIDDIMADNFKDFLKKREALYRKLDMVENKPLLLCALPPKLLYAFSRSQCDFANYHDLVQFWIQSLLKIKSHNVVLSLHPATEYDQTEYIKTLGVKIAKNRIIDLIPLCDLFVGSASSVMYFATACAKPVLNYDVYKFKDEYFMKFGMVYTDNKKEFLKLLEQFTQDKKFYKMVMEKQRVAANRYGILDGKSGDRILTCIDNLVNKYHEASE